MPWHRQAGRLLLQCCQVWLERVRRKPAAGSDVLAAHQARTAALAVGSALGSAKAALVSEDSKMRWRHKGHAASHACMQINVAN